LEHRTTRATAGDFAIWIRPVAGGGQSWELLDDSGERVLHGLADDQTQALAMARCAVETLRGGERA
jgi:hypothetical protein